MHSFADELRQTATRLRSELSVDPGLDETIEEVASAPTPADALALAQGALTKRVLAVQAAGDRLEDLLEKLQHLQETFHFHQDGWPTRRAELAELLKRDPIAGVSAWLSDWILAASKMRLDALERLTAGDLPVPPSASLLLERCRLASAALRDRQWAMAIPVLQAAADGLSLGGEELSPPSVRADLHLLLARMSIDDEPAESHLIQAGDLGAERAELDAVRAMRSRHRDDAVAADELAESASVLAPGALSVVVELVHRAARHEREEAGLELAQSWVDALVSLVDVESDLARLVEPVPAELWLAVAQRALREGDLDMTSRALDAAEQVTPPGRYGLSARINESRVAYARARALPRKEVAELLVAAGGSRVWAGNLREACSHYDKAMAIDEENLQAPLALADALCVQWGQKPLNEALDPLRRALGLIERSRERWGITDQTAWSLATEASVRRELARVAHPSRVEELGRALGAATRAVIWERTTARRWPVLSDLAESLELNRVAVFAARRAAELADTEEDKTLAADNQMRLSANMGEREESRFSEGNTPWHQAVEGYVAVRKGDPERAIRKLREATVGFPEWIWARESLIYALLITGQTEPAEMEAARLREYLSGRLNEMDKLWSGAFVALVLGDLADAERLGMRLRELEVKGIGGDASFLALGWVRLLQGDAERGIEHLAAWMRAVTAPRELEEWGSVLRPALVASARKRGVALPELDHLDDVIRSRRLELAERRDPISELDHARQSEVAAEVVTLRSALRLLSALVHLERREPEEARSAITPPGDDLDVLPEVRMLLDAILRSRVEQSLHLALAAVELDDAQEATSRLREAVDREDNGIASTIFELTQDRELIEGIRTALVTLRAEPSYRHRVESILEEMEARIEAMPSGPSDPAQQIQLDLPSSWFSDVADPVREHALFLRFIPEARARAKSPIPGLLVQAQEDLEPDGYRILLGGERLDEGTVDPNFRYFFPVTEELLPPAVLSEAQPGPAEDLVRIPAALGATGLVELLTMPAMEVIVRRLEAIVTARPEMLGTGQSSA